MYKNLTDVNECADAADNNCSPNADCFDEIPGFMCMCRSGFSGNGVTCDGKFYSLL